MAKSSSAKKIVVITGGSSGIGKKLAQKYIESGDTVINLSRTKSGLECLDIVCDLIDMQSIKNAVDIIKSQYSNVDLLINNAGKGISGATELLQLDQINQVIELNYTGALFLTQNLLQIMKPKSKIVNISSACALFALPYRGVYCASKSAMNMMSFSMAMELSDYGIKVVSICPGDVKTEFTANRIKFGETNEKYGDSPQKSADAIDSKNDNRMNPDKVASKIKKIADKKNGHLYIIGFKYKIFNFFQRILPTTLFNNIVKKIFVKK